MQDLARGNEVVHRADDFFDRGFRVVAVALIEIEMVGAEATQRRIDRSSDVFPRQAALENAGPHRKEDLAREDVGIPRHAVEPTSPCRSASPSP
jgi:hypothetical protein